MNYKGYKIYQPVSGGKAGKGKNETTSFQVRHDNIILKNIGYKVGDKKSYDRALEKAKSFIDIATNALKTDKK